MLTSGDVSKFSSVHKAIESMKDDDSYSLFQMVVGIPRVNARVHKKVLVLFQELFSATAIFLQLRHFPLDVFQEVRVEPTKLKLPYNDIWLQHITVIYYRS